MADLHCITIIADVRFFWRKSITVIVLTVSIMKCELDLSNICVQIKKKNMKNQ
jgi:hypothetical protein